VSRSNSCDTVAQDGAVEWDSSRGWRCSVCELKLWLARGCTAARTCAGLVCALGAKISAREAGLLVCPVLVLGGFGARACSAGLKLRAVTMLALV
jgi:hypothetical protein